MKIDGFEKFTFLCVLWLILPIDTFVYLTPVVFIHTLIHQSYIVNTLVKQTGVEINIL